ncbi:hypothetical protein PUNSTDRAFT_50175 [Punctularia strigosozonata HHB-11173 SS5]|uniref:uncharacterized protein n=1 Tax=Punctularia strigosozonata (strain HHB-11173) TaxID=741275 RepID=UPI0004416F16|nr:uncharacterized protein PUNSTDRAFT_50175 [Punctularia strigosozonata HHB-11173 SS5]EIN12974.1 hypothetical protein PUNSTDRAFT_50175 [Punctularia strigosozonata HHB-11173 SS5]
MPRHPPRTNVTPTAPLANLTLRSFTPPQPGQIESPRPQRPLPRRAGFDPLPHGAGYRELDSGDEETDVSPQTWSASPLHGRQESSASPAATASGVRSVQSESDRDEEPSRKRGKGSRARKAAIACNRCRKRKIACDGIKPHPCSSCLGKLWECVYVEKQRRRGPGKAPRGSRRRPVADPRPDSSAQSSPDQRTLSSPALSMMSLPSAGGGAQGAPFSFSPVAGPSHLPAHAAPDSAPPSISPGGTALRAPERDYQFIAEQPGMSASRRAATRRRMEPVGAPVAGSGPSRAGGPALYHGAHGSVPSSVAPHGHQNALGEGPSGAAGVPTGEFTFSYASTAGRSDAGLSVRRGAGAYGDGDRHWGGGGEGAGSPGRHAAPPAGGSPNRSRGGTPAGNTRPPQRAEGA